MAVTPKATPRERGRPRAPQLDGLLRRLDVSLLAIAHFYIGKTVSLYMDKEIPREPYRSLFSALRIIRDCTAPVSIRDVQREVGLSHPATSRLIDRSVAEGFVERKDAVFDRRHATLTLTPRGMQVVENVELARRRVIGKLVADWPAVDIENLDDILERLGQEVARLKRDQPGQRSTARNGAARRLGRAARSRGA